MTLATAVLVGTAASSIPQKINYQGLLADRSTGEPIVGSVDLTFRLYDASLGGTELWSESQTVEADSNGVVAVILGSITLIDLDFDDPVWLQVEVGAEVLSPRREIVSVPYAFYAEKAENADSLGGEPPSAYSVDGHDHDDRYYTESELSDAGTINDVSNPVDWTKLKGVPAGFVDGTDDVGGAGDGHSLDAADGSPVDVVYVDNAGEVGIGTTSPERPLHIYDGSAGSVTYTSGAELVIEDDGNTRIQMVTPNDKISGIEFGDTEDSGSGYVLYTHAQDKLRLGAASSDRMVVSGDGNVGIGTPTPGTRLHVLEDTNSQTSITIENTNTGSVSSERLGFDNEDGSLAYIATYDDDSPSTPSSMVIANNRPGGNLKFRTGGIDRLEISNFGATTITAPGGSPLDCQTSGAGYIQIETDNTAPTGLRMQNAHRTWYLIHSPSFDDRISIFDNDATGTRERLTVAGGTGYVGIHNTNPSTELDVAGKLYVSDNSSGSGGYSGQFFNSNSSGAGLTTTGNNALTYYVSGGTGLNSTGYHIGAYVRANEASATGGQRAIQCALGTADYTCVCYRHSNGLAYDVYGNGLLGSTMPTTKGYKTLTPPQSPEAWIEDYGSAEIKGGFCHVDLDPLLLDCVTIDEANPAKVFVQLTSPITNQFYVEKGTTGFDVVVTGEGAETVDATFDYRVVAARKNQEKLRFVEAETPEQVQAQAQMVERQAPEE